MLKQAIFDGSDTTASALVSCRSWAKRGIVRLWETSNRQGILALVGQSLASATNFFSGVIIGRVCSKEEFGFYTLGLSIVFVLTTLQISLITTPYMVYSPRLKTQNRSRYTGSVLIHQFILSTLAILSLFICGRVLTLVLGSKGLGTVINTLSMIITFILLKDCARQICFAGLRMKMALLMDLFMAVLQLGGLVLLATLGLLSASSAYWVIGCAGGCAVLVWLFKSRKIIDLNIRQAGTDFKRSWRFGKWVFASAILWSLSMNLYPWILTGFHGAAAAGIWAACLGVVAISNPLIIGVQNFLGPKITHSYSQGGADRLRQFVLTAIPRFALAILPFSIVLVLWGGKLVAFLYGGQYAGNGLLISILAINLLVTSADFSLSRGLFARERADLDFKVNFLALIILLTIGVWLVSNFGPLGVAISLLVSSLSASSARCITFLIQTGSHSIIREAV